MIRNDYRRALIMLRGLEKGYSGHVRLERRTLNGNMQFTVNAMPSQAPLYAVLLNERNGQWSATNMGQLRAERRDQAGLYVGFDPRNVQGLDLDDYQLVGIAEPVGARNKLVLSGFLNGTMEVDYRRVGAALAQLFQTDAGAAAEPEAVDVILDAGEPEASASNMSDMQEAPVDPSSGVRTVAFAVGTQDDSDLAPECALCAMTGEEQDWPERIMALRALFEQQPPFEPFAAPGYVFVRAPLTTTQGEDGFCAIGLKSEAGAYTVLCYAIPGSFQLEPPPGLEGYSWRGTGNQGYWTTCIDIATGEPYEGDDP